MLLRERTPERTVAVHTSMGNSSCSDEAVRVTLRYVTLFLSLGPGQRIIQEGKNRLVLVESERFKVVAGVVALPMLSVALVGVENKSDSPLSAEQARVFLLDSTSQPTYRFTDFELRLNLLNAAGVQMPSFQPPPPRPNYTIMS